MKRFLLILGFLASAREVDVVVIGKTKGYDKIIFGYNSNRPGIKIDLNTGVMQTSATKSCTLEADTLANLRQIMLEGKLCGPAPLPPSTPVCDAISLPDIKLQGPNEVEDVELSRIICHRGVVLCGDQDEMLRSILSELSRSPKIECMEGEER